ncbi:MAG: hypothetical protein ABR601_02060 [Parasphingopyxis sp.]|nr:division/cell wall cluster transcriptional repressor MraZ [Sphingomonadales bacterium]
MSLPADFRNTIERRAVVAKSEGYPVDDKQVLLGEDEELPCLVGFDEAQSFRLQYELEQQEAESTDGGRRSLIRRGSGMATFAPMTGVVFDKAGRMVLPPFLRDVSGIGGHAFFYGTGRYFDVWSPKRAHEYFGSAGDRRMVRIVEHLCREKGVKL